MESDSKDRSLAVTRCNGAPITRSSIMKTTSFKVAGKTVFTYGFRPRVSKSRYGVNVGTTFTGLHLGKASHYLSMPMLVKRKFGGQADIVNT